MKDEMTQGERIAVVVLMSLTREERQHILFWLADYQQESLTPDWVKKLEVKR